MKTCCRCKQQKSVTHFCKRKDSADGLSYDCRDCRTERRQQYARSKNYRQTNLDYYYRNKDKWKVIKARRRAAQLNARPDWLTEEDEWMIAEVYDTATLRSKLTGVPHEVDHIVPLQGVQVCGLHVPWNLQVLTRSENRSKGCEI